MTSNGSFWGTQNSWREMFIWYSLTCWLHNVHKTRGVRECLEGGKNMLYNNGGIQINDQCTKDIGRECKKEVQGITHWSPLIECEACFILVWVWWKAHLITEKKTLAASRHNGQISHAFHLVLCTSYYIKFWAPNSPGCKACHLSFSRTKTDYLSGQ